MAARHADAARRVGSGDGYGLVDERLRSLPPAYRRGATRDLAGAVLRSRVRVRGDAAQPPAAPSPDAAWRTADAVPAAGRLVGLDLHHLDDQLVRSRLGARAAGAAGGDGIQPADGRRHPRGLRPPGAAVRLLLRRTAGGAKRVQRLRDAARQRLPHRLSPDPGWSLASGALWLAGGFTPQGARTWLWIAALAVDYVGAVGGLLDAAAGPLRDHGLGDREQRTSPSGSSSSSSSRWASRSLSPGRPRRRWRSTSRSGRR